ncbi:MAG: ATP-binding protein [Clostridia bacterium]|nr:ATP-binding protein [Clostridia bacterium]
MEKYRARTIEKSLQSLITKFPVIMVTGPRQVGKTTLLNYIAVNSNEKINYVSLDNLLVRQQAIEDPELFLRTYEAPVIIDEFQYAPKLLSYIKIKVDEARKNAMFGDGKEVETMYFLTGSQVFQTMANVSESLAGRMGILDLYGFSTRELEGIEETIFIPDIKLLKQKEKVKKLSTKKLFERILNGSYPEVVNGKIDETKTPAFYETYIRTYIERDVRQLINVKDETKFLRFISSVAARTAQEYNVSDIATDVGVDSKTIDEWVSILKNTNLIYMLQSYSNNNVKKAIKRPKIYFMDTGLACYLTGYLTAETLEKSAYNGAIFETYVVSEIIKTFTNNGMSPRMRLYYYRDSNAKEIDLLIIYDNKVYPVEIKKSANPGKTAFKNFDVVDKFGLEVGDGLVLCMIDEIFAVEENKYFVPIEYI